MQPHWLNTGVSSLYPFSCRSSEIEPGSPALQTDSLPAELLEKPPRLPWWLTQMVKRLSTMQETRVRFLGQEDPRRKKWQFTPVLLPGKSHGQRSLVGYSPWGCKESDTTERLHFHFNAQYFVLLVTFLIVEKLSFEHTVYQFIGCNLVQFIWHESQKENSTFEKSCMMCSLGMYCWQKRRLLAVPLKTCICITVTLDSPY